ncbi:phosphogluconate dehydratase [Asticcacaulis endophyticus]|uniref:Phosphogluconate dehydratase n=1 Tax=Asticcacaulis endophyticus TaxID=1395890 RepID=A0A918QHI7_9CAUL|nr:phosphogluconate dehydratase [Asticcacaulis endophyticus]GGZ45980.1 phosphogluconate dehydratase [Asticcacaulis endophyticus]
MTLNPALDAITQRITDRSKDLRAKFEARTERYKTTEPRRKKLSCANYAHVVAASTENDKLQAALDTVPNIGVVTAYNDMLSAHQPYHNYPEKILKAARKVGATSQVAGGVPAMCDGVTQGRGGMELSLFSRDVIAMSAAIALSHDAFDAALMLGVCDKIVPGLVIGALSFAHLPVIFVPAGPMSSGLPNPEKARIRTLYARGEVGRDALLAAEMASYHGVGTCTFYGTANSNQMLMEMMGLHVPGSAFIHPHTELREALTAAAVERAAFTAANGKQPACLADVLTVKAFVNGVVGLMATGGSTNHALHLPAMARAAGIILTPEDLNDISRIVPLLARVYPNGSADTNHFHAAGGVGFVMRELLSVGLLHADVQTIWGEGLGDYCREPILQDGKVIWRDLPEASGDEAVLRPITNPFSVEGGLREMKGNLGIAVSKISAVKPEHQFIEAPCAVFDDQDDFLAAFKAGNIPDGDFICVVRFQGPKANGMPELHSLTPSLSSLLDQGRKVALVSDGRMSGASGKVASAIHLTPEAKDGGPISKLRSGDVLRVDCENGTLSFIGNEASFLAREPAVKETEVDGLGRELFAPFRRVVGAADEGGAVFW